MGDDDLYPSIVNVIQLDKKKKKQSSVNYHVRAVSMIT